MMFYNFSNYELGYFIGFIIYLILYKWEMGWDFDKKRNCWNYFIVKLIIEIRV